MSKSKETNQSDSFSDQILEEVKGQLVLDGNFQPHPSGVLPIGITNIDASNNYIEAECFN